jgi:hypothetical protein
MFGWRWENNAYERKAARKGSDVREDASICHLPPPERRLSGCRIVTVV